MLKNKGLLFYAAVAVAVVLAVGTIAYAYTVSQNINVAGDYYYQEAQSNKVASEDNLGAISGPDVYQGLNLYSSFTTGNGFYLSTSTVGTAATLSYSDLANSQLIRVMSNTGNLSYTMPATSTMMQLLPKIGSTRKWLIHNATTTAATTFTLVKGAGMDVVAVTANDDVIDGGEYMQLTCTQIPYLTADNENIMCIVDELTNAD